MRENILNKIEFIIYVADQKKSKEFYESLLGIKPSLDVPGMTEFDLGESVKLGLMPEKGIARLLSPRMPHPASGSGIPRCELYIKVENAKKYFQRGLELGATMVSPLMPRDWGDTAGYLADFDGHVIAFAEFKI